MDCVLKIVTGNDGGREFRCGGAETIIGRSARCAIRLEGSGVSYEHAVVSRNGNEFFIENLSANGTYLNDERLSGRARLHVKDQIRVGQETVLRVENLPAATMAGSSRRWLLGAVVMMMLVLAAVVVIDPFGEAPAQDWSAVYAKLQAFTETEGGAGRLPAETPTLLREAWRLETTSNRTAAGKAWLRLRVLLASTEEGTHIQELGAGNPSALTRLRGADKAAAGARSPSEDELLAALLQFVMRMERRD